MDRHRVARTRRVRTAVIAVTLPLAAMASTSTVLAQVGVIGGSGAPSVSPPAVGAGRPDVFVRPGRAETALIAGDWLLYPSLFGGAVYDSNVNQSAIGARSSAGLRLVP